jgi:hypothetical protein
MASKVGDLKVSLNAEIRNFQKQFRTANTTLSGFGRKLKNVGSLAKGAFAVGGGALLAREFDQAARAAISYADEIAKAAKTGNIGAESLQTLRRAAVLAGESQKGLDDAVGRFSRRLGEARRGNTEYAKTFRQLGVTINDTTEQALDKVIVKLADIKDGSIRTSFATKVFGDDARRMALLVENGAASLAKTRKETKALGLVMSNEFVTKAELANNALADLDLQLRTRLADAVLKNIDGFIAFKEAITGVEIAFGNAFSAFGAFTKKVQTKGVDDALAGQRFGNRKKIAELQRLLIEAENDPLKGAGGAGTDKLRAEILRLQTVNARLKSFSPSGEAFRENFRKNFPDLPSTVSDLTGALQPRPAAAAVDAGGAFNAGFLPPLPSLKSNALAKEAKKAGEAIAEFAERSRPPMQQLRKELETIKGLMSFAQNAEETMVLEQAAAQVTDQMRKLTSQTSEWSQVSVEAGRRISDAFADAVFFGTSLENSLKRLGQQLASRALSNYLFGSLTKLPSVGGLFGGARADGGPVQQGTSYLVGERGPELFRAGRSGFITPNGAVGGGANISVVNRFDVSLESVQGMIASMTPKISAGVVEAYDAAKRRSRFA